MSAFLCPRHNVHATTLPCPDRKPGCLMAHFGCPECARDHAVQPSQFSDTPDEECPLCTDTIKCKTTAVMEHFHGTPEFVQRRADLVFWAKFGKERTDLADRYERVWNLRCAREQTTHRAGTPLQGERSTDFHPDWTKYPKLSAALARHLEEEMTALLRDARADAVRFIRTTNAEELQKAFERGRTFFHGPIPVDSETYWAEQARRAVEAKIQAATTADTPEPSLPPVVSPPSDTLIAEAGFWKRMLIRTYCGCLALDCRKHGAYVSDEVDRVFATEEIAAIQAQREGKR